MGPARFRCATLLDEPWVQLGFPRNEQWTESQNRMLALDNRKKSLWEESMLRGKRRKKRYVSPNFLPTLLPMSLFNKENYATILFFKKGLTFNAVY